MTEYMYIKPCTKVVNNCVCVYLCNSGEQDDLLVETSEPYQQDPGNVYSLLLHLLFVYVVH